MYAIYFTFFNHRDRMLSESMGVEMELEEASIVFFLFYYSFYCPLKLKFLKNLRKKIKKLKNF